MTASKRNILALPAIGLAIGIAVLVYGYWEHKNDVDEISLLFDAHVDSVAALVEEGAREAAISTALLYEQAEQEALSALATLSFTPSGSATKPALLDVNHWLVQLHIYADETVHGVWGPIPESEQEAFLLRVRTAPRDEMLDDPLARSLDLFCMVHDSQSGPFLICRDAGWLNELRREVGIGPLLKGVIKKDILYVALQDATGVLAVAPSPELLSPWSEDADLARTLDSPSHERISRLRTASGRTLFEGLIPFEMVDESQVLLRVGIDAAVLQKLERNAERRYLIMVALIIGINALVGVLAVLLARWQRKKEDIEELLARREAEKKQWESMGQLAATVAHEVRNPLNTMKMIAQRMCLEFKVAGADQQKEFDELLALLKSEGARVNQVVTDFLDLGKPMRLTFQKAEIATELKEALRPLILRSEKEEKSLVLECDCERAVLLDPGRFKQLLTNLVENGLEAVEIGGEVRVTAECDDSTCWILVRDNGPGLNDTEVREVMKPFVSYRSNGTGLGLPLVQRLVAAHGGCFELVSTVGRGTTARIGLPLNTDKKNDNSN